MTDLNRDILSSLKFIAALQPGDKISTDDYSVRKKGGIIKNLAMGVVRYFSGESRHETYNYIVEILTTALTMLKANMYTNSNQVSIFITDMIEARKGIKNLMETYKDDRKLVADAISNLVKPTQELQHSSQHPSQKSHSPNLNPLEEYVQEMLSTPICPRYQTDGRFLRLGIDLVFGDNDVIIGSNQGLGLSSDHIQASIDHLNTQFIEDDVAKNSTRNEEHNTNIEYEIQRLKYKLIDDLHFVRESRSTSSELKNRAIFVTKYLAGYPTWVAYEFAGCERFGLPYGGLAKVYVDFMCSYITDPTLYKSIFEALLIEAGGITVNEAIYMPCFKYNDVFQYNHPRREDGKLMTSFKNFNLYFYLKKNNILILTELAGLSTLKNHLAETKEFLPMLKSIRRRLMNYISPDADMYTEMVVTLPQCNIKEEMTVYEIVNQCLYALLGFRKLGEMIDSSPYPARNVRAISAVITLQELKKYLKEI